VKAMHVWNRFRPLLTGGRSESRKWTLAHTRLTTHARQAFAWSLISSSRSIFRIGRTSGINSPLAFTPPISMQNEKTLNSLLSGLLDPQFQHDQFTTIPVLEDRRLYPQFLPPGPKPASEAALQNIPVVSENET
jgi:hypothetical protein